MSFSAANSPESWNAGRDSPSQNLQLSEKSHRTSLVKDMLSWHGVPQLSGSQNLASPLFGFLGFSWSLSGSSIASTMMKYLLLFLLVQGAVAANLRPKEEASVTENKEPLSTKEALKKRKLLQLKLHRRRLNGNANGKGNGKGYGKGGSSLMGRGRYAL